MVHVQCTCSARAVHVQVFSTHHFLAALRGTRVAPPIPNSQVTRIPHQLKIHWGCRSCGVPAARARGEEAVLTWGPPVKVNFELATPNSVHGCTLARPTWRRMKKGAGVHGARAVHVQVFSTHHFLAALRGTRVAPPIPNSQVTRIPYQLKMLLGVPFLWGASCTRQGRKTFFTRGPSV